MDRAVTELSASGEYNYLVVNRSTEESVAQLQAIIQTEHLSLKRRHNLEQVKAVIDELCGVI